MNPNTPARQGSLPPLQTLIKVEDFARITHLNDETKEKYRSGVARLYEVLNTFPPESQHYQNAYKKLVDVTMKIRQSIQTAKQDREQAASQAAATQHNDVRPASSGPPGQNDPRPQQQPQPAQGGGQTRPPEYSQKIIQEVKRINIVAPTQVTAKGPEAAKKWVLDAQNKYAQHLQSLEASSIKKHGVEQMMKRRNEMGNPLNQSEIESLGADLNRLEQSTRETKDFLHKFQMSQREVKTQQAQMQAQYGGNGAPNTSQAPNIPGQYATPNPGIGNQSQVKQEPQSQPHTSATHAHPQQDQRNQNNHAKMPIPKDLNLQPTQPVSMGPSRPTMTNGPNAMGAIGQPAIQRHPGYVLEGEGEHVLSKKKLEELVRQVTGGTGGEGEEGEALTAEVEETLLSVADDFVDQVIVAACRLAKLRNSSTLELRDLQLILERNYNIRVPGYASDELRTVRKTVPTQAWTQKLSAVQAAKVTGGKGDL
ncbi:transcription initiation factor TFIID subunit 12, partial [Lecanoromycetidae sp. Uapishka_2]